MKVIQIATTTLAFLCSASIVQGRLPYPPVEKRRREAQEDTMMVLDAIKKEVEVSMNAEEEPKLTFDSSSESDSLKRKAFGGFGGDVMKGAPPKKQNRSKGSKQVVWKMP